jgi:hypothetical protein
VEFEECKLFFPHDGSGASVDLSGFHGEGCLDVMRSVRDALRGKVVEEHRKPEAFERAPDLNPNRTGLGRA